DVPTADHPSPLRTVRSLGHRPSLLMPHTAACRCHHKRLTPLRLQIPPAERSLPHPAHLQCAAGNLATLLKDPQCSTLLASDRPHSLGPWRAVLLTTTRSPLNAATAAATAIQCTITRTHTI